MKSRRVAIILTIGLVIFIDQALKLYIKTHFAYEDSAPLIPGIIRLYFVENFGMAFGMHWGGYWGKYILSIFRLIAIIFIGYYLNTLVKEKAPTGFIICLAMILAGALGNLIDSSFYGLLFNKGLDLESAMYHYRPYEGIAEFSKTGYASFFQGSVVDMLQFTARWPSFIPWLGGKAIFSPIFNIADAAISVGVFIIVLFNKRYLNTK